MTNRYHVMHNCIIFEVRKADNMDQLTVKLLHFFCNITYFLTFTFHPVTDMDCCSELTPSKVVCVFMHLMAFCNLIGYLNPDKAEQKVITNQTRLLLEEGGMFHHFQPWYCSVK